MFILSFFKRFSIILTGTIPANINDTISISNWPEYKFSFLEFLFNHLLPIILTTLLTLLITWVYDKSRNRDLKKNQFLDTTEKYVEEFLSINEELLLIYLNEEDIGNQVSLFQLRSRIRENNNRILSQINRFSTIINKSTSKKFFSREKNKTLEIELQNFVSSVRTTTNTLIRALNYLNSQSETHNLELFIETIHQSPVYNLNQQLLEITALLL
ncbi:DUF713 domain-containing protein [Erysipelothrix sp. strain 2 (EsS2-6-Brazil)]|uniref:DUF713 domain-containing protein n=1 Tax=Erysipelothrix sp. strain 2 (EsS2-6-Brazil) TaxID=2500549 RepID=UPI001909C2A4|nr:DUF713 domain-containing protein [Erysipelothrix sp. strain 2 (EsS2-6-Brazil)]MDE8044269.1 DUF713 domain-containing protein [Erysipelothrix rhusiopathiae]MBK2401765.1 DUF713 domain-containing protein [Erysipelothrix sp. strain 2 (EsS2-6-Brazil)]MDE8069222.1 DUF713 domain-containing protein [Erysipelothrix rhusiopathiae]MDE8082147.1 DUF713 domain-containing protein [Erysipelothrix rhusiopathiae]MDE8115199.1 DUF713 domain-containing protein [Erysipelothrix rhusiopathiae]